ncbi:CynX/NimT family MFS transporter [Lederbergia galactosidilytica]|uniref:Transporter n=1 Tax=Lederbergia galactosidilytica TaxID=217031 RepID=A0A177ZHN8_9BACI|nr:MFS transporter [Lederbergia galactosidilytica]MBP1916998.1 CP family cyanate transporter-like MFS transporter [Lederbergia galactosidilytica]OAK67466.1 transporter [Lederbergia galactosidilytica]
MNDKQLGRESSIQSFLLILGIIFIAFNLRPAITSVGPLIGTIRTDFNISNGVAGMITTLPLLAFALFSIIAPIIGKKWGNEATIFVSLLVLLIGALIRSSGNLNLLFLGTAFIGIGIAICNVLLPAIVKQRYPYKVGIMTSIYSTSMGLCAATASGLSIPLAKGLGLGWHKALLVWGTMALIAAIIWFPQVLKFAGKHGLQPAGLSFTSMFRSSIAWQVTLFLGLQSILFYGPITWLPEILVNKGFSIAASGWMLSFMQFCSLPANFITPVLAGKLKNQRPIVMVVGVFYIASLSGLLIGGGTVFLSVCVLLLGIAQGACISLALTLFSLRAADSTQAAQLSGMAQSVGYLLAAVSPILIGILFDYTQSWTLPLSFLLVVSVGTILSGLGAGRDMYVGESTPALKEGK